MRFDLKRSSGLFGVAIILVGSLIVGFLSTHRTEASDRLNLASRVTALETQIEQAKAYDAQLTVRILDLEGRTLPDASTAFAETNNLVAGLGAATRNGETFRVVCSFERPTVSGPDTDWFAVMNCARVPDQNPSHTE